MSGTSGDVILERTIDLTQGQSIQLGLSWLVTTYASSQIRNCTNYELYVYGVYNSNDYEVSYSTRPNSSCELIRYTAPQTLTYRIVVKQQGARNQGDNIALTYNVS